MKYKPYHPSKVLSKLNAARKRLGRLYASDVSPDVQECIRQAGLELGKAERLLVGYEEEEVSDAASDR